MKLKSVFSPIYYLRSIPLEQQRKCQSFFVSLFFPFLVLGMLGLLAFLYQPSQAAADGIYVVNTTADMDDGVCDAADCSLREAINAANGTAEADTIIFSLPPSSTITLNGMQLPTIIGMLTIDGSTAENLTISGDNASRIVVVGLEPPLSAQEKNADSVIGGATAVTITNLTFADGNIVTGFPTDGGAIYSREGKLTVIGSTFISNSANQYGGAIRSNSEDGLLVANSTFISNSAGFSGGAIWAPGVVTITNSTFISNSGGAIVYSSSSSSTVNEMTIFNSAFTGNAEGAIITYGNDNIVNIVNSTFDNNSSGASGGVIYRLGNGNEMSIFNSTFNNNSAGNNGGAILANGGGSVLSIFNSTFNNNSAGNTGGAINTEMETNISNSTISGNSASSGGAIAIGFYGELTINNSTISGNSASATGSGIYNFGMLNFSNTIIANGLTAPDCFNEGTIVTNVNNLVEDGTCNALFSGDPLLGPLQDNGGDTWTHALMFGSPAVDTGDPAACANPPVNNLDQRGITRPLDGDGDGTAVCDIGAYEIEPEEWSIYLPIVLRPAATANQTLKN